MSFVLLSSGEKHFIIDGIEANVRNDGRKRNDYRPMEIETDIITHANGSARIRLANSDILVGVKVDLDVPLLESPNCGKIEFFVDCSANATPIFEGRGGDDLATEIGSTLSKAYGALLLSKLCIKPGQKCWILYVDVLILECAGNLYDAASLAVQAALYNTRIPKITDIFFDGTDFDFEFSDNVSDCWSLDLTNAPCFITFCKIGDHLVIDPTAEEESCSVGSIVVSVTNEGKITAVVKIGEGSFQQNTILQAIELAVNIGKDLNGALNKTLKEEEKISLERKQNGFLR